MIIKQDEQAEVLSNFDTDSIDMTIDDSDKSVLMHILSTGLYQDPIGSLIRENVSNNLDATVESGSKEPVIAGLKRDDNYNWYFYSQDFGTGISPDRIEKIVSKYAASTKRGDGAQKGYFGLGLKSSLAYTDSFWIITNYEGVKYSYLMYKGEKGSKVDLMDSQPTEDKNGTTFKVYIKNNSSTDIAEFKKKMREQLSYIENLYFDAPDLPNDYPVYKADDWWFTPYQSNKPMHIVLDGIYYPIDFGKLGIPPINVPVALKFELTDGLVPIPSRESMILSPATKTRMLEKIKIVADDMINRFNRNVFHITGWPQFMNAYNNNVHTIDIDEKNSIRIGELSKYSDIEFNKPTFSDFQFVHNEVDTMISAYRTMFEKTNATIKIAYGSHTAKSVYRTLNSIIENPNSYTGWLSTHEVSNVKLQYIKENYSHAYVFKYKPTRSLGKAFTRWYRGGDGTYIDLLKLKNTDIATWRNKIKEFQAFEKYLIETTTYNLDTLVFPEAWLEKKKQERLANRKIREQREIGEFLVRSVTYSDRSEWGGRLDGFDVDGKKIRKMKGLWIYGNMDQKVELAKLATILKTQHGSRLHVLVIANQHQKYLKGLKNFITYDDFMKGGTKPFRVYATAVLMYLDKQNSGRDYSQEEKIEQVNPKLYVKMKQIDEYIEMLPYRFDIDFAKAIVNQATEFNQFDPVMLMEFQQFKEEIQDYDFLQYLKIGGGTGKNSAEFDKGALSLAREVLKHRKIMKKEIQNDLEAEIITTESESEEELEEFPEGFIDFIKIDNELNENI